MAQITNLYSKENSLKDRLNDLNKQTFHPARVDLDVAYFDDLVEVNAGGEIITAKRSTSTQLKGARL